MTTSKTTTPITTTTTTSHKAASTAVVCAVGGIRAPALKNGNRVRVLMSSFTRRHQQHNSTVLVSVPIKLCTFGFNLACNIGSTGETV